MRSVTAFAGVLVVGLLTLPTRYGVFVDELYFRLLSRRPAWGYFDQPPLAPMSARVSLALFGDTAWALRLPGVLAFGLFVVLVALLAKELGARPGIQLLAAVAAGLSPYVLAVGNSLATNAFDLPLWTATMLFTVRALRRDDGRWWLAAGAVVGVATYNKHLIALLVIGVLVGLALVGPRRVLRDRLLWAGMAIALVIALPNLLFQMTHGWPQLTMAQSLMADLAPMHRAEFLPQLFVLIGPTLAPIWIAGLVRLAKDETLRAMVVAYVVCNVLVFVSGGRPDYAFCPVVLLFVAGLIAIQDWLAGALRRRVLVGVAVAVNVVVAFVTSLSLIPVGVVGRTPVAETNEVTRASIGWPELAAQVASVYHALPAAERPNTVVIAGHYGQAGALDLYRDGLPSIHSGHNELYNWGPPRDGTTTAVVIGVAPAVLDAAFARCDLAGRVDNGVGVANPDQGREIRVCRTPKASWQDLWPSFRTAQGYV